MNNDFRKAGEKLSLVFEKVLAEIKPGVILADIDRLAEKLIIKEGAKPSFKMVPGYQWTTCINLNEGIVHGIPDGKKINKGDIVSLDMGLFYAGKHTDMAYTVQVGKTNDQVGCFLRTGETALKAAIAKVKPGNRVGDISAAIQEEIESQGYACVRELAGHGVGDKLHQDPWIFCFLRGKIEETPVLKEGMGLAIEVIYTQGSPQMIKLSDGWTIETKDGRISALFEKTVLVTQKGVEIITPYKWGELVV